jgi:hypothetical protein
VPIIKAAPPLGGERKGAGIRAQKKGAPVKVRPWVMCRPALSASGVRPETGLVGQG